MLLGDIAARLQTQGIGTVNTSIFMGYYPDKPDNLVALFEYAGEPTELLMGTGDPVLERPGLQARVRNLTYPAGRAKIQAVADALHGLAETTMGGKRYLLIRANQSPESLGRDENNRCEFVVNFSVLKER